MFRFPSQNITHGNEDTYSVPSSFSLDVLEVCSRLQLHSSFWHLSLELPLWEHSEYQPSPLLHRFPWQLWQQALLFPPTPTSPATATKPRLLFVRFHHFINFSHYLWVHFIKTFLDIFIESSRKHTCEKSLRFQPSHCPRYWHDLHRRLFVVKASASLSSLTIFPTMSRTRAEQKKIPICVNDYTTLMGIFINQCLYSSLRGQWVLLQTFLSSSVHIEKSLRSFDVTLILHQVNTSVE